MLGLLSASFALGNLIGPQIGGYLSDHYGFPWSATIIGTATFGYLIILLTFGGGFGAFRTCCGKPVDGSYIAPSENLSTTFSKTPDMDDSGIEFQNTERFTDKIDDDSMLAIETSEAV